MATEIPRKQIAQPVCSNLYMAWLGFGILFLKRKSRDGKATVVITQKQRSENIFSYGALSIMEENKDNSSLSCL